MKDRRRDQRPHLADAEIVGFLEHTVTNSSKTAGLAVPPARLRATAGLMNSAPKCRLKRTARRTGPSEGRTTHAGGLTGRRRAHQPPPGLSGCGLSGEEPAMRLTATARRNAQRRAAGGAAADRGAGVHAGGGAHAGARHRRQQRHLRAGRCGADAAAAVRPGRTAGDAVGAHCPTSPKTGVSPLNMRDWSLQSQSFEGIACRAARHGRRAAADRAGRFDRNGGAPERHRQFLRRPPRRRRSSAARSGPKTTARRRAWCCSAKPCGAAGSAAIPRSPAASCA